MKKVNSVDGVIKTEKAEIFTSDYALRKRHNTADTSIEAYRGLVKTGRLKKENDIVMECLKEHQPINTRMAAYKVGIEKTNVGRCLHGLVKSGLVKIAFKAKCPITDERVGFYALTDWVAEHEPQQAA